MMLATEEVIPLMMVVRRLFVVVATLEVIPFSEFCFEEILRLFTITFPLSSIERYLFAEDGVILETVFELKFAVYKLPAASIVITNGDDAAPVDPNVVVTPAGVTLVMVPVSVFAV